MTFTLATGNVETVFPTGAIKKISVQPRIGDMTTFGYGRFAAPALGIYRFDVSCVISGTATNTKVYLLDDSGGILSYLALSPTGILVSGFDVLTLAAGQIVWLGAQHSGAGTETLSALNSSQFCKVLVTRMDA